MTDSRRPAPRTSLIRQIGQIGRTQRGLITADQLDRLGLGPSGRYWAVATGRLIPFRRGVHLLPGVEVTWETTVLAAALSAGPGAVASHVTAARLWDLFDGRQPADTDNAIYLTAPSQHRLEGVHVHRQPLEARERSVRRCVPVTSVARTIFDLGAVTDPELLGRCTDEALRRRVLNLGELHRLFELHRGSGRRRLDPVRQVLAGRLPGYDPGANDWERRMDRLWDQLGLPPAERQHPIVVGGKRRRVDRAIPELRLAIEWVGKEFHGQLGRFDRDRMRISDLVQAGWDVLEVTPGWTSGRLQATVLAKVAERRRLFDHQAG